MCGRIVRTTPRQIVVQDLGLEDDGGPDLPPHYNIPPSSIILVVRERADGKREATNLRWGLLPSWARDEKSPFINARAETAASKPAFRAAFRNRRCVIPVDGFFEWQEVGGVKLPHLIRMRDERPFLLGGLWESWTSPAGSQIETCAVMTTEPNEVLKPIHGRMPVIISRENIAQWLDPREENSVVLHSLLGPYPSGEMVATPVGTRVNNPKHDDADCLIA